MASVFSNWIQRTFCNWPTFSRENFESFKNNKNSIRKAVAKLAIPVVIEQLLITLTQIVDMLMVGKLGPAAVASIGLITQPANLYMGIFMGISVGTTVLVAMCFGRGNIEKEPEEIARQTIFMTFVFGLFLTALTFVLSRSIVHTLGADAEVTNLSFIYFTVNLPGLFFLIINSSISAVLRGAGETKTPMIVNTVTNLLNIIGNYIFIFGKLGLPPMGVAGAALSTTLSRVIGAVWLMLYARYNKKSPVKISMKKFRFNGTLCKRILRIGIPTSVERVMLSMALFLFQIVVAGLGTAIYAAHTVALNIEAVSFMPGIALGVAATTVVGQSIGAQDYDLAYKSGWEAWKLSAVMMGFLGLIMFIFPDKFIAFYIPDPEIIRIGSSALRIMALSQIPMSAGYTIVGALRGAGDTRTVLVLTMISVWFVRLSAVYLFVNVFHLGLTGAWMAMSVDWIVRCIFSMIRFHKGKWRNIAI